MKCEICEKEIAIVKLYHLNRALGKNCFIKYFEKKVLKEIRRWKLIKENERVVVATSGGKDSLTALFLIRKFFPMNEIIAIAIDEGIKGYRDKTLVNVKKYCENWNIPYYIFSFSDEFGFDLDSIAREKGSRICSYCGVLRRYLMNKKARELKAKKIVVGHNLDDEVQSILMNVFRNDLLNLIKLGPIAGILKSAKFIPRVKPLRKMYEREIMVYALVNGIFAPHRPCPYVQFSYRDKIRNLLNDYEWENPGTKARILKAFDNFFQNFKNKLELPKIIPSCKFCGEPSSGEVCKACRIIEELDKLK